VGTTTSLASIPTGRPFTVDDSEVQPDVLAHVVGDEPHTTARPFPVTIVRARLLDGTRP